MREGGGAPVTRDSRPDSLLMGKSEGTLEEGRGSAGDERQRGEKCIFSSRECLRASKSSPFNKILNQNLSVSVLQQA